MADRKFLALALGGFLLLPSCRSGFTVPPAWSLGGQTAAYHQGPLVAAGETGPRRFVMPMMGALKQDLSGDLTGYGWKAGEQDSNSTSWVLEGHTFKDEQIVLLRAKPDGVAARTLLEMAKSYGSAIQAKDIPRPARSLVLYLGESHAEHGILPARQSLLAELELLDPIAQPCTLQRTPDPEAVAQSTTPSGLNLVMRLALVDVGMVCRPWKSLELPYEAIDAQADSSQFPQQRISLAIGDSGVDLSGSDQPEVSEAQRAGLALWAGGAALAGARGSDLDRYLSSLLLEARLRHYEAEQSGASDEAWQEWLREARLWLRSVVFGLPIGR